MKTVDIGRIGEKAASRFLKGRGYKILAKNLHISHNEIDIIARDKQNLIFIEVKTRTLNPENELPFGTPAQAVNYAKQQRTIQAARSYIKANPTSLMIRFDVIEFILDNSDKKFSSINHIIGAFGA